MKKAILKIFGVAALAAGMLYNVQVFDEENRTNMALALTGNMAVANCESSQGYGNSWSIVIHSSCHWTCYQGGSNSCPL